MSLPTDLYKKKKKNSYSLSILFLIVVIVSTGALYLYNNKIAKDITEINSKIKEVDILIENIKKDEKLQIYSLIESNKKALETLRYNSNIPDFIEHFKNIEKQYKIRFKSFKYSGGQIKTSVVFEQENEVTYSRVVNFIKGYRESDSSLFNLEFIKSITGHDVINFSIGLNLKEPVKKVVVKEAIKEKVEKEESKDKKETKEIEDSKDKNFKKEK